MAASAITGPRLEYGPLAAITSALSPNSPLPSGDGGYGVNGFYQGASLLDPRWWFPKDQVTGFTGKVGAHFQSLLLASAGAVPAATSTTNIAGAQNVTSGTAMTLAAASAGITLNVPIIPFSGVLNSGSPTIAAMELDFGFAFGNCTSGSKTITVANSADFAVSEPLCIGGVGNSGGTACLLTFVTSLASATTITVNDAPQATNATAPIGTGNLWGPTELSPTGQYFNPEPTAASPFLASGPLLLLDGRQALTRAVQITGVTGGAGGTFTLAGWDFYRQPQTETITVAAGASTGYGKKAFKDLASVTPNFTDAHNYSVGTSDVFGLNYRAPFWDVTEVTWA